MSQDHISDVLKSGSSCLMENSPLAFAPDSSGKLSKFYNLFLTRHQILRSIYFYNNYLKVSSVIHRDIREIKYAKYGIVPIISGIFAYYTMKIENTLSSGIVAATNRGQNVFQKSIGCARTHPTDIFEILRCICRYLIVKTANWLEPIHKLEDTNEEYYKSIPFTDKEPRIEGIRDIPMISASDIVHQKKNHREEILDWIKQYKSKLFNCITGMTKFKKTSYDEGGISEDKSILLKSPNAIESTVEEMQIVASTLYVSFKKVCGDFKLYIRKKSENKENIV